MPQHFLLSAKAGTLSLRAIYEAGEEKAFETFKRLRWTASFATECRNYRAWRAAQARNDPTSPVNKSRLIRTSLVR